MNYMSVYHRLEYEMNRHLQAECGLSMGDYTVMNALSFSRISAPWFQANRSA